jgi:hypothetical protein
MIDPVATLRLATLRGLWTDTSEAYPEEDETIWWEVWLRRQDGNEFERLMEFAATQEIEVAPRRLMFDDRLVTLVRSMPTQLAASIDVLNEAGGHVCATGARATPRTRRRASILRPTATRDIRVAIEPECRPSRNHHGVADGSRSKSREATSRFR